MHKFVIGLVGASLAAGLATTAPAAPWQSINQRQVNLERRIDRGIRTGDLNRREAARLRTQYAQLQRLEYDYRRSGGLSLRERSDLDRRFDALSASIRNERSDRNDRQYSDRQRRY